MPGPEDSGWKEILDRYFPEFLEFFFPEIHKDIDWSRGYECLDKELEPIIREAKVGKQLADMLVKVSLLDGSEAWILIHVEVQGRSEPGFAKRIFDYNYRIYLRYGREVVSVAVLTDPGEGFRPQVYERKRWGFELVLRFPAVKIIDYEERREEIEESRNPFSMVVLTHLDSRKARTEGERFDVKFQLVRRLYRRGYRREDVIALYKFMDWLVRLPRALEEEFHRKIKVELEGKKTMPYISSIEQFAMEKGKAEGKDEGKAEGKAEGLREGLVKAISLGLKLRFGERGLALLPQVHQIEGIDRLQALTDALSHTERLEDFSALL